MPPARAALPAGQPVLPARFTSARARPAAPPCRSSWYLFPFAGGERGPVRPTAAESGTGGKGAGSAGRFSLAGSEVVKWRRKLPV